MEKKGFAFLDMLGFSNRVLSGNTEYAYNMLNQVYTVLEMKDMNGKFRKYRKSQKIYQDELIDKVNSQIEITSFSYLQCVSDSILIASDEPDLMVQQIANIVRMCFTLNLSNNIGTLPLVMLRGGISYGEVNIINAKSSLESKAIETPNTFGKAIVNAVKLEKYFGLKGPRVILDELIYEELSEQTKQKYVSLLRIDESIALGKKYYEILWPAFEFNVFNISSNLKYNDINGEITNLGKLLSKAYIFFDEYENSPEKEHYNSLISLIFRSAKQIFYNLGGIQIFEEYVKKITNTEYNKEGRYISQKIIDTCKNPNYIHEMDWNDEFRNYLSKIYNHRIKNSD